MKGRCGGYASATWSFFWFDVVDTTTIAFREAKLLLHFVSGSSGTLYGVSKEFQCEMEGGLTYAYSVNAMSLYILGPNNVEDGPKINSRHL